MAVYLYLGAGKKTYETLHKNLEGALPSLGRVIDLTREYSTPTLEGELRCDQLRSYLDERALEPYVWLSEDGTRVTGGVEYDVRKDRCVGFPAPLDPRTGMPNTSGFSASSAEAIQEMFDNNTPAKTAYVVMAQPLRRNAAAFALLTFGTDNKFSAQDMSNRFRHTEAKTARSGVTVLGVSADGGEALLTLFSSWVLRALG